VPWVRIDDHFNEHPKLAAAGPLAWALWFAGLAYCNRNLTDGFIPWSVAHALVSWDFVDGDDIRSIYVGSPMTVSEEGQVTSRYVVDLIVEAGLWVETRGGFEVHDFAQYQPTKAAIEAERAAKIAAGRAGGVASATARATADARASAKANGQAKSKPVPVPVPAPVTGIQGANPLEGRDADARVDP